MSNTRRHEKKHRHDLAVARRELARGESRFVIRQRARKHLAIFKWISIALAGFVGLEVFLLPEPYKVISDQWAWNWALGLLVLAGVLLFVGTAGGDNKPLKRWTFWLASCASFVLVLFLSQTIKSHHPYIILGILVAGFYIFYRLWPGLSPIDCDTSETIENNNINPN